MSLVNDRQRPTPEQLQVIQLIEQNAVRLRQLAETDGIREDDIYKLRCHIDWLYAQPIGVSPRTMKQRRKAQRKWEEGRFHESKWNGIRATAWTR